MKYYHRGNGEVVVPDESKEAVPFTGGGQIAYEHDLKEWLKHLKSLPASKIYVCDPAEPIGWLPGYEENWMVKTSSYQGESVHYFKTLKEAESKYQEWYSWEGQLQCHTEKPVLFLVKPVVPADKGDEYFYCRGWEKDGSKCEEQCQSCKKASDMPEVKYTAREFAYEIVARLAAHGKLDSRITTEEATNILEGAFKQFAGTPFPNNSAEQDELWVKKYEEYRRKFNMSDSIKKLVGDVLASVPNDSSPVVSLPCTAPTQMSKETLLDYLESEHDAWQKIHQQIIRSKKGAFTKRELAEANHSKGQEVAYNNIIQILKYNILPQPSEKGEKK